jgi:uncharacterized coiled-coil DUF342 family protein
MILSLSTVRQRLADIDRERDTFNSKQRSMDDCISSVTASVSKLAKDVLGARNATNALNDRLMAQIQQLMAMVQDLSKAPDLQHKLQHQPPRTSPLGLTLTAGRACND